MRPIGFSTGAVARQDFETALNILISYKVQVVELSALRLSELAPLARALDTIDTSSFKFVSFHAPSSFEPQHERMVVETLRSVVEHKLPVIVHPDVLFTAREWLWMGPMLWIENMDRRKAVGRNTSEMASLFERFPDARLCFDIGHSRQVDATMTEAKLMLRTFEHRLAQIHISEVNTSSRHDPLSTNAITAYRAVARLIPENIPIILETLIDMGQSTVPMEIRRARKALDVRIQSFA